MLEGGISPGDVLARLPTSHAAPTFTFVVPTGASYVRVRAIAGSLRSAPSNAIRLFAALGTTVSLNWRRGASGGTPQQILLDVTGAISKSLTLPGAAPSFTYTGLTDGHVHVLAARGP